MIRTLTIYVQPRPVNPLEGLPIVSPSLPAGSGKGLAEDKVACPHGGWLTR